MASGLVNIGGDKDDASYRYKMPRMMTKIEGRGNGIKTVIMNVDEISRALERPPTYVVKYFGSELGAQSKFDAKRNVGIVNGAFQTTVLVQYLTKFIDQFVLCSSCSLPETKIYATKNERLMMDCKACGSQSTVDMQHRLTAFILKELKTVKGQTRKPKKGGNVSPHDADGEDGEKPEEIGLPVASLVESTASPKTPTSPSGGKGENVLDDDWSMDTSKAAARQRLKAELGAHDTDRLKDVIVGVDELKIEEIVADFKKFLDSCPSDSEILLELSKSSKSSKPYFLMETFDHKLGKGEAELLKDQAKKHRFFLTKLCDTPAHQKMLMYWMENYIGLEHRDLITKSPLILKAFYDEDIIDEDSVLAWSERIPKRWVKKEVGKEMRDAMKPFVDWLKTAPEDDSDDE